MIATSTSAEPITRELEVGNLPQGEACSCNVVGVDLATFDQTGRVAVTCVGCGRRWERYGLWIGRRQLVVA